jgi:hypothetical protein
LERWQSDVVSDPTRIDKFRELTAAEIDSATVEELRAAYRALLTHHIEETEKLWQKLRAARQS